MDGPVPTIRCRQIGQADLAAVASLLRRGFPNRTRQFWFNALQRLARREPPPGFPQYGYLLESGDGAVVGEHPRAVNERMAVSLRHVAHARLTNMGYDGASLK